GSDGVFSDSITPTDTGTWTVRATWEGDSTHLASESGEVTMRVEEKKRPAIIPGLPYESIVLGIVLAVLMLQGSKHLVSGVRMMFGCSTFSLSRK
ncbi:MAG: Ig-like domain-containing protein, partial [Candidatus Bathyarchaeota archaeon]|nr:Ig-like domain-containing protein [Candidatus Bathyarchaeota archaeon]